MGIGGRVADSTDRSQNLDSHYVEFTFSDGTKGMDIVRFLRDCHSQFDTYIHGTKRSARIGWFLPERDNVVIYKDHRISKDNIWWRAPKEKCTVWQAEWIAFLHAIREDREHNEAERAAEANLAAIMARAAVHSGQLVTREQAINSNFQFCSYVDTMTESSPPPVQPDERGFYPVPVPGKWTEL